ncbi:hypothetical protein GCM10008955_01540 [Deinococcus malanensis]|uniref:DUF2726 domain-containing protein n=1 Tax=Deinococcus malanensis TaxID=1706855 RepID=A0ABQ2EGU5_9DEIO|nr:hypothetical protein [Deinococcus malanensis]GGK11990.1 hypothetical protein GCM10008955_01540 [Deinococcus malanensis]
MPLNLPKWLVRTDRGAQARTQRTRVSDQFEQDLREALGNLPYEVHSSLLLENFMALTVQPGETQGTLAREARRRVDFAIVASRSRTPAVAIMLTTRAYGRDRRQPPANPTETEAGVKNNSIVPVVHLNPRELKGAPAIAEALKPYL